MKDSKEKKSSFHSKDHYEVKKASLPTGGGKYAQGDNGEYLQKKAAGLASYLKKNRPKNG